MRRRRPSGVTQTASLDYVGTSTYREVLVGGRGRRMGWTATHRTRPYPYIAYTHGQYRNVYLVWIICYQRIAVPYAQVSRSLTCPGAGSSDPCHAITDPGRSSRRQGEHAPEQLRSWSSWPTLGLLLLANGLLGTENWGPLAHRAQSDQPAGQCAQGQVLFRTIDDFVRVLRWASICFVGSVHHLCCLSRCLLRQAYHTLSLAFVLSLSHLVPEALSCFSGPWSFFDMCG